MTPYFADDLVTLLLGDCREVMAGLPDASVDAVVTDPPYGLEFMGKEWDRPWAVTAEASVGYEGRKDNLTLPSHRDNRNAYCRRCHGQARGARRCTCAEPEWDRAPAQDMRDFQAWCEPWASECLRVLRPGGHLVAFGGTRTYHRLACGIEDAGFEVRDSLHWVYGSGFPKSKNLDGEHKGWGTALKPAHEPIVLARKPLTGTVAANVLVHGAGALNIDGCRVAHVNGENPSGDRRASAPPAREAGSWANDRRGAGTYAAARPGEAEGRWPPNVLLTHAEGCEPTGARQVKSGAYVGRNRDAAELPGGYDGGWRKDVNDATYADENGLETVEAWDCAPGCPVAEMDQQSAGIHGAGKARAAKREADATGLFGLPGDGQRYGDSGGASRFFPVFRYQAKAPASERPRLPDGTAHPTVKPVDLMSWLVRLVTPPGGTVLDPFLGSGTTAHAARMNGFRCIGIEADERYCELAAQRLSQGVLEAVTA